MSHPTRRTFLKRSAVLAAALPFAELDLPGAETPAAGPPPAPADGPCGLLFDASDLPRIRANARHPRFATLWQAMHAADLAADRDFLANKAGQYPCQQEPCGHDAKLNPTGRCAELAHQRIEVLGKILHNDNY